MTRDDLINKIHKVAFARSAQGRVITAPMRIGLNAQPRNAASALMRSDAG
jgi:hypothetical protein